MVKVFVNSDNTATLRCPNCEKTKIVDVAKFLRPDRPSRLRVSCPCGHSHVASLEKRKNFRKETCLEGTYRFPVDADRGHTEGGQGRIRVLDLSRSGMRLELFAKPKFQVGDLINVSFRLDNSQRSLIERNVYVKNISGKSVGVEYAVQPTMDSVLGFYLFN